MQRSTILKITVCHSVCSSNWPGVLPLDGEILGKYLAIPKCTLSRAAGAGHFSVSESRNLAALIRVLIAANELFEGDVQAAELFLTSPSFGLNSKTPMEVLNTECGVIAVTDLIGRLEHGIPI
jgi:putative toxin-antitoxin system antitoxin component (TIGR02293 family)